MLYVIRNNRVIQLSSPEIMYQEHCYSSREDAQFVLSRRTLNPSMMAPSDVLQSQTISTNEDNTMPPYPTAPPLPPPLKSADSAVKVNGKWEVSEDGLTITKYNAAFQLDVTRFGNFLNPSLIEESFKSQAKIFLNSSIGEMIGTPEFKELMKPKIQEYLKSMTIDDVMEVTGKDVKGILALLED
jgi:hypothetical protein